MITRYYSPESNLTAQQSRRTSITLYISFNKSHLVNEGLVNLTGYTGCKPPCPRCYPLLCGPVQFCVILPFVVSSASGDAYVDDHHWFFNLCPQIEAVLQRNHSPRKLPTDQAYRLQQGFMVSSSQQVCNPLLYCGSVDFWYMLFIGKYSIVKVLSEI